ncbi:MAG: elongation factor G [Holophagaceae bacterium]|nr:elongation factor G [Holophagaceae bacterium]
MTGIAPSGPRAAALVGPYLSGKTSLMEAILLQCGAIAKKGLVKDHNTVGDSSAEAKARGMSVDLSVASATYLGEAWTFLDCPGSVEFTQDAMNALLVVDVAVVVAEPEPHKAPTVAPVLQFLDERKIPHVVFINKVDAGGDAKISETLAALQAISSRPLILREIPLKENSVITGFVDLVSEHAYGFKGHEDADLMQLPEGVLPEEHAARQEMLERLADFDDHLMEELLGDVNPPVDEISENLKRDLEQDLIVPVFFGSAEGDHGIKRLLQALRDEAPEASATAARVGVAGGTEPLAQIFKTVHAPHVGKQSLARIWRGEIADGTTLNGARLNGIMRLMGSRQEKVAKAAAGEVVSLGRLEEALTGQTVSGGSSAELPWPAPLQPFTCIAMKVTKMGDEVKLSGALHKLCEEDPSLSVEQNADTHEQLLWGQGEIHLKNALDRLKSRFGLDVKSERPQVPYKETIRKGVNQHGRYKHQSGGHGAFGDVYLDIKPLPRGSGYQFAETIVGGVVPRQYFSSVDNGVKDYLKQGPLGFPVVDIAVTLTAGSYHTVDSSDMAFKAAARVAMTEGMPLCMPVLLEPIVSVEISVPNEHTAKAQRLVTGRRAGQILGFDAKEGWKGWDVVNAFLPQSEMHDLIVELRSLTMGVGTFAWKFDHLQEMEGREADAVVKARKAALEAK